MPKYIVEVIMSACVAIEVEAFNENEAQTLALEEAEHYLADEWEYKIESVYRDDDDEYEEEEE